MSDNRMSKILENFTIGEAITSHNGVVCYPAMRNNSDEKYILKTISVPASNVQLAALLLSGAYNSREDALEYYKELAQEIQQEARAMAELSNLEGFVPFLSCQISEKEDRTGYEVSLMAPYQLSLEQIFSENVMTHQGIIDLAMDLCSALAACRRAGYLYVDLKPTNIFYDSNHGYRIGDLGFQPLASLKYASMPEKYHSIYTAPEITDAGSQLNETLDVYALGLILYQAYNGGMLSAEEELREESMLPPLYADYEMAQIILSACQPDPDKRWKDPTTLGQALVQYMQNYGVPAGSIVPAPVATPELDVSEEFLPEEEISDPAEWEDIPELAFMQELISDDTAPTMENTSDIEAAEVSEETTAMLAQVDELIAHVLPEPVVAPEPIHVPMPEPIPIPEEPAAEPESVEEDAPQEEIEEASEPESMPELETEAESEAPAPEPAAIPSVEEEPKEGLNKKQRTLIIRCVSAAVIVVLLISLGIFGFQYYNNTYLQSIDGIQVSGTVDSITVQIQTGADETLLSVTCSDTYGNTTTASVTGGVATFTGLSPQTRYTIRVSISGFHKLTGVTTDSFTTASQTSVDSFTAAIGPADGSVFLSFAVEGLECDEWILTYWADGVAEQSATFAGHSITIYDLKIGAEYTFRLSAGDESNIVGQTEVKYLARTITRAENATITACGNGSLTVQWELPAGETVSSWTLRCYNSSGYDSTVTTDDLYYTFNGLSHDTACTVEITAEGMPQGVSVTVDANPINITGFQYQTNETGELVFTWEYTGATPEGGWVACWSCDSSTPQTITTEETFVNIANVPGGNYTISLIPADGTAIFGHTVSFSIPIPESFAGYGITANDLQFMMCVAPNSADWHWQDVPQDAYKTDFSPAEAAAFVVWCGVEMEASEEMMTITFLLRKEDGTLVDMTSAEFLWNAMWNQSFCELNLPFMPQTSGNYRLWIFFDGMLASTQNFTIQ